MINMFMIKNIIRQYQPASRDVRPAIAAYEVPRDANPKTWPPATTPIRPPTQTIENPQSRIQFWHPQVAWWPRSSSPGGRLAGTSSE